MIYIIVASFATCRAAWLAAEFPKHIESLDLEIAGPPGRSPNAALDPSGVPSPKMQQRDIKSIGRNWCCWKWVPC